MAISILAALSLLIAAFAAVTRLERRASSNWVDGERARIAAWSGVERARFELRRAVVTPAYPMSWLGYHVGDDAPPPLEAARRPSLRVRIGDGRTTPAELMGVLVPTGLEKPVTGGAPPDPVPTGVAPRPSGFVGATYFNVAGMMGDYYTLRIEDANARLFVNDTNPHLRRMLDTLARATNSTTANAGQKILAARPPGGYQRIDDLRGVLGNEDYERMAPHLTTHAWVDRKVIECGDQLNGPDTGAGSIAIRAPHLVLQGRAPVNMNAAPLPVLAAVLAGIGYGGVPGHPTKEVTFEQAMVVAAKIEQARNAKMATAGVGIQKWGEFYTLLAETDLEPLLAAAVLANCNPNADLNKFVPDITIYRPIDKSDLTKATTELCFASGGLFEVDSLGVVLDPDGKVVAQARARATIRAFERYVERSQADFETDRIDPESPSAQHKNLRDMITLPEFRNASDSAAGLLAAEWDGQVTFNVITEQAVSTEGAFLGFIGRELAGKTLRGGDLEPLGQSVMPFVDPARGAVPAGGPAAGIPNSVLGGDPTAPAPSYGSDLHPLGARLGAEGRSLSFAQNKVISTYKPYRKVPESEVIMTDGHGSYMETLAVIPSWTYEPVVAEGFELWFKPDFLPTPTSGGTVTGSPRQTLLYWESGGPQDPGAPAPVVGGGGTTTGGSFVTDVHEDNVQHFIDACNAGGPTEGNYPEIHVAGGGSIVVQPPPPSEFLGAPIRVGNFAYKDATDIEAHAEIYAQRIDAYFARAFSDKLTDLLEEVDTDNDGITWGAKARFEIWLQPQPGDPISPFFQVMARFEVQKKDEEFGSTSHAYGRIFSGPLVRPGTWHHALFSFYAVAPVDGDVPPEHSNLWVDGRRVTAIEGADSWPTEIHAQARIAKRIIDSLASNGIAITFDPSAYRVPVEIPLGTEPVRVGVDGTGNHQNFRGLVDNVIFQGNWPKTIPDAAAGAPDRYDLWRPSLGRKINKLSEDHHLRFTKRTKPLEWDVPVTVVSYDWTKWNELDPKQWKADSDIGFV